MALKSITIDLPYPPSVNRIWRSTQKGVYRSPAYLEWIKQAGLHVISQKPHLVLRAISGPYALIVRLKPRSPMADLDNCVKAISDLLQAHRFVDNDRLCRKILMLWDETLDVECRVTIRPTRRDLTKARHHAE
jgi:crossover junction endodeoxyribonuclease RusA